MIEGIDVFALGCVNTLRMLGGVAAVEVHLNQGRDWFPTFAAAAGLVPLSVIVFPRLFLNITIVDGLLAIGA
jgi:hypothetical protein